MPAHFSLLMPISSGATSIPTSCHSFELRLHLPSCAFNPMASYSQVPIPPDVPIPPSPDSPRAHGLGLDGIPPASSANLEPEPSLLSPFRDAFRPGGAGAAYRTPSTSSSTPSSGVAMTPRSPHSRGGTGTSQDDGEGPFNFQPMTLTKSPISKSVRHLVVLRALQGCLD